MAVAEPFAPPLEVRGLASIRTRISDRRRLPAGQRVAVVAFACVTAVAIIGPWLAPHSPTTPVGRSFSAPSSAHWFGTDEVGRDLLSRVVMGFRTSWFGSVVVTTSAVVIGTAVGLVAGSVGGWIDNVLMRITDVFLAMPGPMLAIAVVAALGPSLTHTLIAVLLVWWPFYARIVRGEIRALAARPHLDAARLAGGTRRRLLRRHLLPGALPAILVTAGLDIGNVVLTLAGLSFLGLGAPAPAPELGAMAARGSEFILQSWWVALFPSLAVFAIAVVCSLAGDSARDGMADR